MASVTVNLRLPSQQQDVAAMWLVLNYTAWRQPPGESLCISTGDGSVAVSVTFGCRTCGFLLVLDSNHSLKIHHFALHEWTRQTNRQRGGRRDTGSDLPGVSWEGLTLPKFFWTSQSTSVGQCLQTLNEASTMLFTFGSGKFISNVYVLTLKEKILKFLFRNRLFRNKFPICKGP